jgi:hypothetical protein
VIFRNTMGFILRSVYSFSTVCRTVDCEPGLFSHVYLHFPDPLRNKTFRHAAEGFEIQGYRLPATDYSSVGWGG